MTKVVDVAAILSSTVEAVKYLRGYPNSGEKDRNTLIVLTPIVVVLQSFIEMIVPSTAIATRTAIIAVIFVIALLIALVIGQQIRLRRWIVYLSPLLILPLLVAGMYAYAYVNNTVYRIAPSFVLIGRPLPYSAVYGTNARVLESQAYKRSMPTGPDQFMRLKFQLFCQGTDDHCNAGWLIGNLRGVENSGAVQELVFEIRGAEGNEVVGVTMQDSSLFETRVFDVGGFVSRGAGVRTDWETVRIPLTEFGQLDLTRLNIVSFFVDARHTPFPIVDFDVANIRLE